MMKKHVAVVSGTLIAMSTLVPLFSVTNAFADVRTSQSIGGVVTQNNHDNKADQSLLKQLDGLQGQWSKAHKDALADQLHKTLANFHSDDLKEKAARGELKETLKAYETAYDKYIGHDDGTIVRTDPVMKDIFAHLKEALKDDKRAESKDIEAARDAIQHHNIRGAIDDIQKADRLVENRTDAFHDATQKIQIIIHKITSSADKGGQATQTGNDQPGATTQPTGASGGGTVPTTAPTSAPTTAPTGAQ